MPCVHCRSDNVVTFLGENNVRLIVNVSGHLVLVARMNVVLWTVGTEVLDRPMSEYLVVHARWELVLQDEKLLDNISLLIIINNNKITFLYKTMENIQLLLNVVSARSALLQV